MLLMLLLIYLAIGVGVVSYVAYHYPIIFHAGWWMVPVFLFGIVTWPHVLYTTLKG